MKILQTCWFNNSKKLDSGWISIKYNLLSWALSAYSYNKFYPKTNLITDKIGADLLIDKLDLPYSLVTLEQEYFKPPIESLWVLRKLYSYSIQNEPFIHVDGDSYIFKSFDNEFINSPLNGQNLEYDHPCYVNSYAEVVNKCAFLPEYVKKDQYNRLSAINAGIIGGNNFPFFKYFFDEVLEFVNQNKITISNLDSYNFNMFLEQFIYKKLADKKELKIAYQVKEPFGYPYVYNLFGFTALPNNCNYIHVMNYKQNPTICEQMAQRLFIESPELYERVIKVAKELEATKVFIDKGIEKSIIETHFYRSIIIANQLDLKIPVIKNDIEKQLKDWKAKLTETNENKILADVLHYEIEKYNYIKELPKANEFVKYRNDQSVKVNDMLSLPDDQLLLQNITFGKYITTIESEWKWAEKNEFTGQDSSVNYLDNLKIEASYFQVLLFCYPVSMTVKEQLLDTLSILIIDALQQMDNFRISIDHLIENVVNEIIAINPENKVNTLQNSILDKVRYMLYQGVLCFIK